MKKGLRGINWKMAEYSKGQVNKAGQAVGRNDYSEISKEDAIAIIDNWRAAHAYPLNALYTTVKKYSKDYPNAIISQRIKR